MRSSLRLQDDDPLRCRRCRLHTDLCACDLLQPISTSTKLVLVAHRLELRKSTNTGCLAIHCLENARLCVRGRRDGSDDAVTWAADTTPLLLFPSADAVPLDAWKQRQADRSAVTLIVPDGTWRQTKRMGRRVPGLADVQAVRLPQAPSGYRLRKASSDGSLATLEAIAYALGVLEGPGIQSHLLHVFQTVVDRALWSNGRITAEQVTGGVPPDARQDARPRLSADPKVDASSITPHPTDRV